VIRIVLLFVLIISALAAQPQGNEPARGHLARAIKVIPVPHLIAELRPPERMPFSTMIGVTPGFEGTTSLLDGSTRTTIGDLPQVIRDLTPLSWDDGNVTVDLIGNALLVTGSPDQIHLVEQSLLALTTSLGEAFVVRAAVFALDADADLPAVAPSYAELRTQLAQLGARFEWEKTSTAAAAETIDLGTLATTSYVSDCDVEIAQNSTMANPISRALHLGTGLQVQVHPLAGSADVVVMAQYARGESVAPMREIVLGKDDILPRLQSPTVAIATGGFSGRIRNGGALVLSAGGSWGGRRFGIVVGAERPAVAADAERTLGVFPVGAFLSPALRRECYLPSSPESSYADLWTPPVVVGEDVAPTLEPADMETWSTLFHRALGDDQSSVGMSDTLAFVRGSAAAKQTVGRLLELMQEQFLKTVEVEWRLAGETNGVASLPQRLRFPTLLGRRHCLIHGIETTGVVDAEVEVAQKAGISDPYVVRHFTGMLCTVHTYGTTGSELGTSARLRVVDTLANRTYIPDNKGGIPLDQPTITRSRHSFAGRVPKDGQPIEFGHGPTITVDDRTVQTRPSLTLRSR
jgi:hypothetical protein